MEAQQLRGELKAWEHDFFAANGRKPGRTDIKTSRDIAAKYKLYDKLVRGAVSTKGSAPSSPSRKRKRDSGVGLGASDEQETRQGQEHSGDEYPDEPTATTIRADGSLHPNTIDPYDRPVSQLLSPAAQRTVVGPTPQRNGRVLGLFDLLSPASARKQAHDAATTPSRRGRAPNSLSQTPSRASARRSDPSHLTSAATPSRRVANAASAAGLADILTPSRSRANAQNHPVVTPSTSRTARKLDLDDTPEFLKRHPRRVLGPGDGRPATTGADAPTAGQNGNGDGVGGGNEGDDDGAGGLMGIAWSPIRIRQPRKPLGRSFSELTRDIRRMERERHDDDWDVLRQLEEDNDEEQQHGQAASRPASTKANVRGDSIMPPPLPPVPVLQVEASQVGEQQLLPEPDVNDEFGLLGPDGEREVDRSDVDDDEMRAEAARAGVSGQWGRRRKKGPKRQTRRVNIRPNHVKWQPDPEWTAGMERDDDDDDDDDDDEGDKDQSQDHERAAGGAATRGRGDGSSFESDADSASDFEASAKSKKAAAAAKGKAAGRPKKEKPKEEKPKKARKVNPLAHANYRSLKIKNKNSKAKRGRFGRRRPGF